MDWFEKIFITHYNDIYRYVYVVSRNKNDVEDIVQDVFRVCLRKQSQLQQHPTIKGWLCNTALKITWNYAKKERRRIKYQIELSPKALSERFHVDTVQHELFEAYEILADVLTDEEFEYLREHKEYGYTIRKIADTRGISYTALKQRMWRIMQKIKSLKFIYIIIIFVAREGFKWRR